MPASATCPRRCSSRASSPSIRFGTPSWPTWLALAASLAAVGVLAFVVGRPTLRLKGHYLAMATLGLGLIVSIVLTTEDRITGGPDGIAVPPLALFGWTLAGERTWYWIAGSALLLAVWLALNLIDSPPGRALRALHGSEVAAETVGIAATVGIASRARAARTRRSRRRSASTSTTRSSRACARRRRGCSRAWASTRRSRWRA